MSSSAPQTPRRSSTPTYQRLSVSPSFLRIPYLVAERARSLTPTRSAMTMQIRKRLPRYTTIDDVVELLEDSENIVVLTGAGISTRVGIPDFRSAQGLYNQVRGRRNFQDPQQLFEPATFLDMPQEFWEDVKPIIPKLAAANDTSSAVVNTVPKYGAVHSFLNVLQSKAKLLTTFTQNIDGLELAAGVSEDNTIKCHGSWDTATCITCDGKIEANEYLPIVHAGLLPLCSCAKSSIPDPASDATGVRRGARPRKEKADTDANVMYLDTNRSLTATTLPKPGSETSGKKRKRRDSHDESEAEDPCGRPGLLKPDITFFGEGVSSDYKPRLKAIKDKVDLLLIIGTSLPVEPVNLLPFQIPANVPQVWISKERCQRQGLAVDVELIGECGLVVEDLCRRAKWTNAFLNRVWRNNLGSNLQGQEAKRAKMMAAAAATTLPTTPTTPTATTTTVDSPEKPKLEQSAQLPLRPTQSAQVTPTTQKREKTEKQAVESKVKVELVEGTHNRWLVKEHSISASIN